MKKKIIIIFFSFSLVLWLFTSNASTRCSKIGVYLLDDIFGLNGVESSCKSEYPNRIYDKIKPVGKQKFKNFNSNLDYKEKKQCPENKSVILIIGQSNAANTGIALIKEDYDNLNFNPADNFCYLLSEPVLGAGNTYGDSITSSIGNKIRSDEEIIFLNISIPGSTIYEWIKWYGEDVNQSLKVILDKNSLKTVIWIQGESENLVTSKKYFDNFKILKEIIFKDLSKEFDDTQFLITRSTICANRNDQTKVNEVMERERKKIVQNYKNIRLLKITDNLDHSYRHDGCHFNRKGIDKISSVIANIVNND